MTAVPLLEASGISKSYGDVEVLHRVDIALAPGTVHGLIGRNGAGKSTLVGTITGRTRPDAGELRVQGRPVAFRSIRDATAAGVVAAPQEILLPASMSVEEVITLGAEPHTGSVVRRRASRRAACAVLDDLGIDLDPSQPVESLPVSWQRVVQVAQMLHRDAKVLVLDEPTAAMSSEDSQRVLAVVETLRRRGCAVLYISHRFDEVEQLCDEVSVLRDGRLVAQLGKDAVDQARLVESIMGEDAPATTAPRRAPAQAPAPDSALQVRGLACGRLRALDLTVAPGAIVGLTGLPGSGVEDAFLALSGRGRVTGGAVTAGTRPVTSARGAAQAGIAFLPAARADAALATEPVLENLVLPALDRCGRRGAISAARARRFCSDVVERLRLRPVERLRMAELSGGNQQRVLVGSRLLTDPRFLVLEDPTVGVDISARDALHALIFSLAADGMGCVVGSSDPKELADVCDEIHVLRGGDVVARLSGTDVTEYAIVAAMSAQGGTAAATAAP